MVRLEKNGVFLKNGNEILPSHGAPFDREQSKKATMAYSILSSHNTSDSEEKLRIRFDAMASHDITYVGIVQTARASGLESFPVPYVLTNCHNSLCAVGGTINEDDHVFGLSAAKKYGGIYVPAHQAVIHMYMRECMSGVGKMILGSDSHTRYGALGTMAIGEGGPELVKQLLCKTYDINMPEVVAVYLEGAPKKGVGPQDVALAIIGAVFGSGFVKNKVLEFVGPGVASLPIEFRNGIDVMTTETTCLSSIWITDGAVEDYYKTHGRPQDYKKLAPGEVAYYDSLVRVDLSRVECMIALPFHPSNVYTLKQLTENAQDILHVVEKTAAEQLGIADGKFKLTDKIKDGRLVVDQGVIAGCAGGTFDNICAAADILDGGSVGSDYFSLSVYPASQPVALALTKNGTIDTLMTCGATIRSAFCGPCFGAGDVPNNGALSIRHTTRNFPSREGSKPGSGQVASVALMDARSIAATAVNKGVLTAATELEVDYKDRRFEFDNRVYQNRVYNGYGKPEKDSELRFGPNIADWPKMSRLTDNMLLRVASVITDPVTTTDELIPSGETSSYRSNPMKLAEFTLSRKDAQYVGRAKYINAAEAARLEGGSPADKVGELDEIYAKLALVPDLSGVSTSEIGIGTTIYAHKPGDGSAREQAASCQKVLGGWANIAKEYATKRYRSNLINWGMLPLLTKDTTIPFALNDFILLTGLKKVVGERGGEITAYNLSGAQPVSFTLYLSELTEDEARIILSGCLINYYNE